MLGPGNGMVSFRPVVNYRSDGAGEVRVLLGGSGGTATAVAACASASYAIVRRDDVVPPSLSLFPPLLVCFVFFAKIVLPYFCPYKRLQCRRVDGVFVVRL